MITFDAVSKTYPGGKCALNNISLQADPGEWLWLVGPAGSGKSTFMHIAAGLTTHDLGQVTVNQTQLDYLPERKRQRLRADIGLIKQYPRLMMQRSLLDNVALPLAIHDPSADPLRRASAALDKVGLIDKLEQTPTELSGGERQCVAIARALVHKPKLILADDPSAHLDSSQTTTMLELLQQFQRIGTTVVVATQDFELTTNVNARTVQLHNGKVHAPAFAYQEPTYVPEPTQPEMDYSPL